MNALPMKGLPANAMHPLRSAGLSALLATGLATGLLAPATARAAVPTITTFACPLDNGGGRFYCFIDYASDSAATVAWSGTGTVLNDTGHSDFYGYCSIGSYITVTVTVTNASGTATRSRTFKCNGGPVIL